METTTTSTIPEPIPMLALGDSVMLGAATKVAALGFTVDALESRQFVNGVEVAEALKEQGRLGDVVLVHLGTNGDISSQSMDRMMAALADVPRVMMMTNDVDREWTGPNNELIYATAASHPNVQLIAWNDLNDLCVDNCFASDGFHMSANGSTFYAQVISDFLALPV
jgi:lysophospholipase L1-like esterase